MAKREMFYGWWIVIPSFFVLAYVGATWFGFTTFFGPLIKEFAWSYTAISLAASLRSAEVGLMDVMVGFFVDRFSIRRIILAGSILVGIGWLILSRVNSLGIFYTSFFIICIGAGGISGVVFLTLLTRWFHKRLGLVTGLALSGVGVGGFALPGIVYLLDMVGFRTVFFVFGVTALIIGGITAHFVRDCPGDVGSSPDGVSLHSSEHISEQIKVATSEDVSPPSDYTFREAISKPAFWIITYASTASLFSVTMVTTHIMPYLEHLGYSRHTASFMAMMIPVISIVGRLGIGWISDQTAYRAIIILILLGQLAGIILFLYSNLFFLLILFVILFGVTYGGIVVIRLIALRDYYGTASIGSILGLCFGLTSAGSVAGPLFAGWIFDTTGNYSLAWILAGTLLLVSIPLVAIMKPPK